MTKKELEQRVKDLEIENETINATIVETLDYIGKMSLYMQACWHDHTEKNETEKKELLASAREAAMSIGLYTATPCSHLETGAGLLNTYEYYWQMKCNDYARGIFTVRLESGLVIIGSSKRFPKRKRDIERKYGESITDEYIGERVEEFPVMVGNLKKRFHLNSYSREFFKSNFSDVTAAIDEEYRRVKAKHVLEALH